MEGGCYFIFAEILVGYLVPFMYRRSSRRRTPAHEDRQTDRRGTRADVLYLTVRSNVWYEECGWDGCWMGTDMEAGGTGGVRGESRTGDQEESPERRPDRGCAWIGRATKAQCCFGFGFRLWSSFLGGKGPELVGAIGQYVKKCTLAAPHGTPRVIHQPKNSLEPARSVPSQSSRGTTQ